MMKNNRGVALATLVVAVIIMVTITGTIVYKSTDALKLRALDNMYNDIRLLKQKVSSYYLEHNSLPVFVEAIFKEQLPNAITNNNINNSSSYYVIDLEKLGSISLKYGKDYKDYIADNTKNDVYIINANTQVIYYLKGITIDDIIKYGLEEDYAKIELLNLNIVTYTPDGVPIPRGFEHIEGETKDDGIVIKNTTDGNEFVWVPVNDFADFAVLQQGSTTNYRGQLWATTTSNYFGTKNEAYDPNSGLREPAVITGNSTGTGSSYDGADANITAILESDKYSTLLEQFQSEYNYMVASVKAYGGFYVGRYETSLIDGKVASKAGIPTSQIFTAYTDLGTNWTTSRSDHYATWYGLYAKQKELYERDSNSSVVSGMIYGAQWDAIMNWMKDIDNTNVDGAKYITNSTGMGVYNGDGGPLATGQRKVNNIYDLAGNYLEWTQEAHDAAKRIFRGGDYSYIGSSGPASHRSYADPTGPYDNYSSRLQLYIKVPEGYEEVVTPDPVAIIYNLNGGTNNSENPSTYIHGTELELKEPTRTGYTFEGWYDNSRYEGSKITKIEGTQTGDITLYAKWTINKYTITFDTDGGTNVESIIQDYGSTITAPSNPTKTGYTFVGWDKTIPSTMPAENVTIKAKWTINQYTITFNTDGGSAVEAITQNYGTAVTAPVNPTKTGYTFVGWDKTIPSTMPAENMTITAKWEKIEPVASTTSDGVPIPKGFTYVEGTKDTGVVIQDGNANQYVWVPVENYTELTFDYDEANSSFLWEIMDDDGDGIPEVDQGWLTVDLWRRSRNSRRKCNIR